MQDQWLDVPTFVVEAVEAGHGSWKAKDGWRTSGEDLRIETTVQGGVLQILVTDYDGLGGDDLFIRLSSSDEGRVEATTRSVWHTDVGNKNAGPNADLHGVVLVQSRKAGEPTPVKLAFRLHGVQVGFIGTAQPMFIEGTIEVASGKLGWSPQITSPVSKQTAEAVPKENLREVSNQWPNGKPQSQGWVDTTGRRQGVWTTWYSDGTRQSTSEFLHGERHGKWASYWEDGRPYEQGHFHSGIRQGEWTEHWPHADQMTKRIGIYVAGKKEGQWVESWADGTLRARGAFKNGRESGPWTRWWANGNKLCEGTQENGYEVGEWTYWNEDGSVREVKMMRKPPWARR